MANIAKGPSVPPGYEESLSRLAAQTEEISKQIEDDYMHTAKESIDEATKKDVNIYKQEVEDYHRNKKSPGGGVKKDVGKARWDLLDFEFLDDVAYVMSFGAEQYGDYNWRGCGKARFIAASMRHFKDWVLGRKIDKETGKSHLAHLCCNIMFLFYFEKKGVDGDGNAV